MTTYVRRNVGLLSVHTETVYGEYSSALGVITGGGFGVSACALAQLGPLTGEIVQPVEREDSFSPYLENLIEGKSQPKSRSETFKFYIKPEQASVGDVATRPSWYPILLGAGLQGDITAESAPGADDGNFTVRTPATPGSESTFCYRAWLDNQYQYRSTGCIVENLTIDLTAGKYPLATANVRGLYVEETNSGYPSVDHETTGVELWDAEAAPCIIGATVTLTVDSRGTAYGSTAKLAGAQTVIANELGQLDTIDASYGIDEFRIANRTVTHTLQVYRTLDGSDNLAWLDNIGAGARIQAEIVIGANPDKLRFKIGGQITSMSETDINGYQGWTITIDGVWPRHQSTTNVWPFEMLAGDE